MDEGGEAQMAASMTNMTTATAKDKLGVIHTTEYFRSPKGEHHNLQDPRIAKALPEIMEIVKATFPHYTEKDLETFPKYIDQDEGINIVRNPEGKVVAFNTFRIREIQPTGLPATEPPAKVMYTHYSAVSPEVQGGNISAATRLHAIEVEDPDIVCGSTANPAIYESMKKVVQARGSVLYPPEDPPLQPVAPQVYEVAKQALVSALSPGALATFDNRLIRTYKTATSVGDRSRSHPLFSKMVLSDTACEAVFYMGLKPSFNAKVLQAPVPPVAA